MGISHEYHSAPRRARRGTVSGKLRFLGAVVAILLVSYAITAILEKGAEGADDTPSTNASGIAENILAPLPMQGEADSSSAAQDGSTGGQAVTLELLPKGRGGGVDVDLPEGRGSRFGCVGGGEPRPQPGGQFRVGGLPS